MLAVGNNGNFSKDKQHEEVVSIFISKIGDKNLKLTNRNEEPNGFGK